MLLERGAHQVVALDVGHDPPTRPCGPTHVSSCARARTHVVTTPDEASRRRAGRRRRPVLHLADAHPPGTPCLRATADLLLMVKAWFEVGRELGRGVVRDPEAHVTAVLDVDAVRDRTRCATRRRRSEPLPGPSGNREFFCWFSPHRRNVDPAWTAAAVRAAVAGWGATPSWSARRPTEVTGDQDRDRGDPRGAGPKRSSPCGRRCTSHGGRLHGRAARPGPADPARRPRRRSTPETADAEIVVVLGNGTILRRRGSRAGRRHPSSASTSATWDSSPRASVTTCGTPSSASPPGLRGRGTRGRRGRGARTRPRTSRHRLGPQRGDRREGRPAAHARGCDRGRQEAVVLVRLRRCRHLDGHRIDRARVLRRRSRRMA